MKTYAKHPDYRNVRALKADVERFRLKAERGEIPIELIEPMAAMFAAARRVQCVAGPGYRAMDAFAEALPERYVRGWIDAQKRAA